MVRRSLGLTITLIVFSLSFFIVFFNSNGIVSASPGPDEILLNVSSNDTARTGWLKVGSDPYIDAEDYPTNYINASATNDVIGDFYFDNSSSLGTIEKVELQILGRSDVVLNDMEVYVWNGSWNKVSTSGFVPSDWQWKRIDVTSTLDTWEKINSTKMYLNFTGNFPEYDFTIDYARLNVTYTPYHPQYCCNETSSPYAGQRVEMRLEWTDVEGLSGYIFSFDNGWETPASVNNSCGEESGNPASYTIDNNTGSYWKHESVSEEHWIAYDLGESWEVDKVRIYTDPDDILTVCGISAIYVSDDPSNWGSSLGSCSFTGTSLDWYECDHTDKTGTYINLTLKVFSGTSCVSSTYLSRFYEFDYLGFKNDTWQPMTGTEDWSNVTKAVNSAVGETIRWRVYANDTDGNWNVSDTYSFVTTSPTETQAPTYSNPQTNTTAAGQPANFTLDWNDELELHPGGQYIFSTNNSGTWVNSSAVYFTSTPQTVWNVTILNSTIGVLVQWKFYAKDNAGNWNVSLTYNLTTGPPYLEVNLTIPTPDVITKVIQNNTFTVTATVTCRNAACGSVEGLARYNLTSSLPDTAINTTVGDKPFYVVDRETSRWNYTLSNRLAKDVAVDSNDNIIVVGYQYISISDYNWLIMKFDSDGNSLWNYTYDSGGSTSFDEARGVAVDSNDNIIVGGYHYTNDWDWLIMKFDLDGNQLWNQTIDITQQDRINDVATDSDDNIIAVGEEWPADQGHADWRIMKFNSTGNSLWNYTWGTPGSDTCDKAYGVATDSDNNITVVGDEHEGAKMRIMKFNSSGNSLWSKSLSGNADQDVAIDSNDNITVVGYADIMKFDSDGNSLWSKTYNGFAEGIAIDSTDNITVVGYQTTNGNDWLIMKFNSTGNSLWSYTYDSGGTQDDRAYGVATDSDNNITVVGAQDFDSLTEDSDWRIMKFDFTTNPKSCGTLNQGDSCQLSWTINATGDIDTYWKIDVNFTSSNPDVSPNATADAIISIVRIYLEVNLITPIPDATTEIIQNNTFTVNATVTCRNGPCGSVNGTVRYNASSSLPDTAINTTEGDKPFYIQETPANALKECSTNPLSEDEFCNITWTVNVTGNTGTYWKIDVYFNSSFSNISSEHTNDATIEIILSPNVYIKGIALYYYTGERVNGNVTAIPVENPNERETATVTNGEWYIDFYMDTSNLQHLTIIVDDDEKIGYNELKVGTATATLNCTTQSISLSGYSVDVDSGDSINSGNVRVSVLDTDYTNTTTFSGQWSIDFHPCLIPGKIYTLQVLVSDNTGKRGEFLQKYPAK